MTINGIPGFSDGQLAFRAESADSTLIEKSIHDEQLWSPLGTVSGEASHGLTTTTIARKAQALSPIDCFQMSVSVYRATHAITRNVQQAKVRFYTTTGREITAGPLVNLFRNPNSQLTYSKFIEQLLFWSLIRGELVARKIMLDGKPTALQVRNPFRLEIEKPTRQAEDRSEVSQWRYARLDGQTDYYPDGDLIFDAAFNPGNEGVRGLSPLVVGGVYPSIEHVASMYTNSFFHNDATPSAIITLPPGTPRAEVQKFKEDLQSKFGSSLRNFNYHQIMVVRADDVGWQSLDQKFQDGGAFMESQKNADRKVGQLFGVPPIEMHDYEKTRFDTADEERNMFGQTTVSYYLNLLTEVFQSQLLDPHFTFDGHTTADSNTEKATFSCKSLEKAYEKAVSERRRGGVIVLFDPDSMPITAATKTRNAAAALAFRQATGASFTEANEYHAIDLKHDPIRDDIYVRQDEVNVSQPEKNLLYLTAKMAAESREQTAQMAADSKAEAAANKPAPKAAAKLLSPEAKVVIKRAKKFVRYLRTNTLEMLFPDSGDGELWGLNDAESMGEYTPPMKKAVRRIRFDIMKLRKQHEGEALKAAVKDYFNGIDVKSLLDL